MQAGLRNCIICICISNSLHKENRGQRRRASAEANIRQTIVCMQMLADFCQHLHIYHQATWKPIHPSSSLLPTMVVALEENIEKTLNFQPPGLNLTQRLPRQKLMHKSNQWFSGKTQDMQPPGYRGWETICRGVGVGGGRGGGREGMVVCHSPTQLTENWNVASWLEVVYSHKQPEQEGARKTGNEQDGENASNSNS